MLVTQSCLTLCNPTDCSPPGSSVHETFRQGYWSGLPFPSPGDLPNPRIEPGSPALQADSLLTELQGKPGWSRGGAILLGSPGQACSWEGEGRRAPMCSCRSLQGDLARARRAAVASGPGGGRRATLGLEASRSKVACSLLRALALLRNSPLYLSPSLQP